jgi:hypothetical protein
MPREITSGKKEKKHLKYNHVTFRKIKLNDFISSYFQAIKESQ